MVDLMAPASVSRSLPWNCCASARFSRFYDVLADSVSGAPPSSHDKLMFKVTTVVTQYWVSILKEEGTGQEWWKRRTIRPRHRN